MPWWAWVLIALNVVHIVQHVWTHIDIDALIHAWAEEDTKDVVPQDDSACCYCGKPNDGHPLLNYYDGIPIKVCEIY